MWGCEEGWEAGRHLGGGGPELSVALAVPLQEGEIPSAAALTWERASRNKIASLEHQEQGRREAEYAAVEENPRLGP